VTRLLAVLQALVRRAPATLIIVTVLLTGVLGAVSTQAVQEQGFENFSPENEVTEAFERIAEEFGSGLDPVQLIVQADDGPLLDAAGVDAALELRERLETDDAVSGALAPLPQGGAISTYADLVLHAAAAQELDPRTLDDAAVQQHHLAALASLSEDEAGQATQLLAGDEDGAQASVGAVLVLLDGELDWEERDAAVQAMPALWDGLGGVEVTTLDFRILGDEVSADLEADLGRLLAIAFGLIVVILIAIYRRPVDVIASLLGLVFTIVWMQGLATLLGPGMLGIAGGMNEMTMAIPILLVGLGVDYSIHLTMRYREERGHGRAPSASASGAIGAVGAALALATMTTVVGFLTNVFNPLPPLQDFGIFAAAGIVSAFLIMTTFVPAVRLTVDRWRERRGRLPVEPRHDADHPSLLGRTAAGLAPTATHRPWVVLAAAGVLTVFGAVSATNLSTEFSQTEFFPDDAPALATIELVEESFGGDLTERTEILITGDVSQPGVLAAVDAFERDVADLDGVRAHNGAAERDSVVARVEAVLAEADAGQAPAVDADGALDAPADGTAPAPAPDPQAVEGLAIAAAEAGVGSPEGVDPDAVLDPIADALLEVDPTAAAVVARPEALRITLSTSAGEAVDELRAGLEVAAHPLTDLGLDVVAASEPMLIEDVMDELRGTQISGLVYTLAAAMVILSLAFWFRVREPVLGVLAISAVGLVVAWVLGLMAAVGIPFNVMTAMVSALAIGIGVPFGIHVVNRFLEDRDRFDDLGEALGSTLRNTGGALIGSAVTTIAGFGSLVLSTVPPFRQFGAVIAMTIGFALLASVVVLPAMLSVYERVRRRAMPGREPAPDAEPPTADAPAVVR
jgi:uncharacterized protein